MEETLQCWCGMLVRYNTAVLVRCSVVNITLSGLPTNYSQAAVACVFTPYNAVKALESAALQVSCEVTWHLSVAQC